MTKTMYSCIVKPYNNTLTEAQQHRVCPKHRPTACSPWRRKEAHLKQEQLGDGDRDRAGAVLPLAKPLLKQGHPEHTAQDWALAPE